MLQLLIAAPAKQLRHSAGRHAIRQQPPHQQHHEETYRQASKSGCGTGWSRAYSKAWAEPFGLITDDDDQVILRLNEAADRAAFRHDVLVDPGRLLMPAGIGRSLLPVRKSVSVSGSLTVDLWDEEIVTGIIEFGFPIVFLPHTATEPLTIPNAAALRVLPDLWRSSNGHRATTSLALPPLEWFKAHAEDVRRRLRLMPGDGTYEFAIWQLLRQLGSVCSQIGHYACNNTEDGGENVGALRGIGEVSRKLRQVAARSFPEAEVS